MVVGVWKEGLVGGGVCVKGGVAEGGGHVEGRVVVGGGLCACSHLTCPLVIQYFLCLTESSSTENIPDVHRTDRWLRC